MIDALGMGLVMLGGLLLAIAAWGVIVLPDALARQHAATKAGTMALATICIGAMLWVSDDAWTGRLALILVFMLATLPVASHLLARAAIREAQLDEVVDGAECMDEIARSR